MIMYMRLVSYARLEDIAKVLESKLSQLTYCEYILHDKDVLSEEDAEAENKRKGTECYKVGDPKPNHVHMLLGFDRDRTFAQIRNWFKRCLDDKGEIATTLAMACDNPSGAHDYNTHVSEQAVQDGKHQYTEQDLKILCGDPDTLPSKKQSKQAQKEEDNETLLNDILQKLPKREMVRKYGRDYMKNWQTYEKFAQIVLFEETGKIDNDLGRDPIVQETADRSFAEGVERAVQATMEILCDGMAETDKQMEAEKIMTQVKINKYKINNETGEIEHG